MTCHLRLILLRECCTSILFVHIPLELLANATRGRTRVNHEVFVHVALFVLGPSLAILVVVFTNSRADAARCATRAQHEPRICCAFASLGPFCAVSHVCVFTTVVITHAARCWAFLHHVVCIVVALVLRCPRRTVCVTIFTFCTADTARHGARSKGELRV